MMIKDRDKWNFNDFKSIWTLSLKRLLLYIVPFIVSFELKLYYFILVFAGENGEAMQTESGGEESKEPEEPKVMTLDEYKKQQGERSGPKFNLRKAGEGSEIDPKWKKTYAYKKEKETHDEEEDEVIEIIFFIA